MRQVREESIREYYQDQETITVVSRSEDLFAILIEERNWYEWKAKEADKELDMLWEKSEAEKVAERIHMEELQNEFNKELAEEDEKQDKLNDAYEEFMCQMDIKIGEFEPTKEVCDLINREWERQVTRKAKRKVRMKQTQRVSKRLLEKAIEADKSLASRSKKDRQNHMKKLVHAKPDGTFVTKGTYGSQVGKAEALRKKAERLGMDVDKYKRKYNKPVEEAV